MTSRKNNVFRGDVTVTGKITIQGGLELDSDIAVKRGGQFWDIFSDRRLKTDIAQLSKEDVQQILTHVRQVPIKKFRYTTDAADRQVVGVLADEIDQRYLSHKVSDPAQTTEYQTINLGEMFYHLVVCNQHLLHRVDELQSQLNQLQTEWRSFASSSVPN